MTEFQGAIDFITRTQRFIITAHETPDGDAIGSEIAMVRALRSMGKKAIVLNADPTPRKFAFLEAENLITVLDGEAQLPDDIEGYSLLMLDTNDVHNIGQVATKVLPRVREHFIIDHHEGEEDLLAGNLIKKNASSTAEVIFQIFAEMGVTIDFRMAEAMYTGILFDTGCFIYPKTTAVTFAIARDLVALGVQPNVVYAHVFESNSVSALVLHARVLSTLELELDSHVAILTMHRQMIAESGANYEEADQLINIPLRSEEIRVSVFFKENMEGLLRCSMRSKGTINVAEIAQLFGGGGHRTAAGFKCRDSLEASRKTVLDKLRIYFS